MQPWRRRLELLNAIDARDMASFRLRFSLNVPQYRLIRLSGNPLLGDWADRADLSCCHVCNCDRHPGERVRGVGPERIRREAQGEQHAWVVA
jgi:hypothetical protein